jgi:hypothetical protein
LKRLIAFIVFGMFILMPNSYTQMLGGSIFKNKDELILEKFINLDITKYKVNDVKKIIGQDFQTKEFVDGNKSKVTNHIIFLNHNGNDYELRLSEKNNNLSLYLELFKTGSKNYYFKNCEEIKRKYEKKFGKNFRYTNLPATEKEPLYLQSLKFQLNYPNHTIELFCNSFGDNVQTTWITNKSKNNSEFMDELIFISCVVDRRKVESKFLQPYEKSDSYQVKRMDVPDKIDLFIDNYSKKIGRRSNYNLNINGDYTIFNKDRVEVVEKKSDVPNLNSITWQLNRVTGDIEILMETKSDYPDMHYGGIRKTRLYGNCQKSKGNVL